MKKIFLTLLFNLLLATNLWAANNHYIREGGTGSGDCGATTGWADACNNLPATLTRGDTYYIADGYYGGYTFDDAVSGATPITIKKATISDHGTSTGWLDSYGNGTADFGMWNITTSYWIFDGQVGQWASDWPDYVQHGFRVLGENSWTNQAIITIGASGALANNITIRHVEAAFTNTVTWMMYGTVLYVYGSDLTVQYSWFHNSEQSVVYLIQGTGTLFEYCFIEECGVGQIAMGWDPPEHSVVFRYNENTTDGIFRYNVLRRFRSSGGLILAGGNDSIRIYGNIFTLGGDDWNGGGNGVLNGYGAGTIITNTKIYNNTFVDIPRGGLVATVGIWGGDLEIKNNLFYSVKHGTLGLSVNSTGRTHNWYYDVITNFSGESNVQLGTGDPFVNRAGYNYHLSAGTNAGQSLSSPYNSDMDAKTRGADGIWDRGAYEFNAEGDVTPPYRFNAIPSGNVACDAASPVDKVIGLQTNENATCKYDLSNVAYASMSGTFDGTGTTVHTKTIANLDCNASHTYYARCMDSVGNVNPDSTTITFFILPAGGYVAGPLIVHPTNPRYFKDPAIGRATYLTGSHTWANLVDNSPTDPPAVFDFNAYLAFLASKGHNYIRLWAQVLPKGTEGGVPYYCTPFPWQRTGPGNATDGKLKFDLTLFNQTGYFDRLRARVIAAGNAGIYVGVMLFEGWGLQYARSDTDGFPMSLANNINSVDDHGGTNALTLTYSDVTAIQEAYIEKVVDTLNDLDNFFYEIVNEAPSASTAWQAHMLAHLNTYQAGKAKQHLIGMTWQSPDGLNSTLFSSNAAWISPNETDTEGYSYATNPRPSIGSKIIINDTDHWGSSATVASIWKSFTRGMHPILMDWYDTGDPPWYGGATNQNIMRLHMGQTLVYANKMNLAGMTPQPSLCPTTTYCLIESGKEYLVYQPSSGSFTVTLAAGRYDYEWFNPTTGLVTSSGEITWAGGDRSFSPDFSGIAVLYLRGDVLLPDPVMSNPRPSGPQPCTGLPTSINLQLDTLNEDSTCKYGQSGVGGVNANTTYASLPSTYFTTGARNHLQNVSLGCGQSLIFYSRCGAGNTSSAITSFSIETPVLSGLIQAEDGVLVSPMVAVADAQADGGYYITTNTAYQGTATFTVAISQTGYYRIRGRVLGLAPNADSFFLKIDSLDQDIWDLNPSESSDYYNIWYMDYVTKRGTGTVNNPQYDPYIVNLTAGNHTFIYTGREIGVRLDYFYLASVIDNIYPPEGLMIIGAGGVGTFIVGPGGGGGIGTFKIY